MRRPLQVCAVVFALALFAAACTSKGTTEVQPSSGAGSQASVAAATHAAAVGLDPSFGSGGTVTTSISDQKDQVHAIAIQPDGKIVAVGSSGVIAEFALARYDTDGALDTSFGHGGIVTTDFSSGEDVAYGVAVQSDGKIVVAGSAGYAEFALARYDADGSLDPTFGDGGKVRTQFAPGAAGDFALSVAIQPDGKIVAVGRSDADGASDFALARYDADGSLDPTFGRAGKVTTNFHSQDGAWDVSILPDGKILAAGYGAGSFALARYNTDGTLDPTFGADGQVADVGGAAFGVAEAPSVGIVAVGTADSKFALARFDGNGSLDRSFGEDGVLESATIKWAAGAHIAVQPDGRIVSVGAGPTFTVVRFNRDGTADPRFGPDGTSTVDFGSGFASAQASAVAVDAEGRIIAAGSASRSKADSDFALVRYLAG